MLCKNPKIKETVKQSLIFKKKKIMLRQIFDKLSEAQYSYEPF